jgi:hypothetical protein
VDTLKTTKKATAEAEAGHCRYRDAVGKDREKAQRQKSKFSEEQVRKVSEKGWRGGARIQCVRTPGGMAGLGNRVRLLRVAIQMRAQMGLHD